MTVIETPRILFATTNHGKLEEVRGYARHVGSRAEIIGPADLGLELDVEETGSTLGDNAILKAKAWRAIAPRDVIVAADDTGFCVDALGGAPGIHVRRWADGVTPLSDEQIIECCLTALRGVPRVCRTAHTQTTIALIFPDEDLQVAEGTLRGHVVEQVGAYTEGMPLESLFFVDEWGVMLGEHRAQGDNQFARETHRTRAFRSALTIVDRWVGWHSPRTDKETL